MVILKSCKNILIFENVYGFWIMFLLLLWNIIKLLKYYLKIIKYSFYFLYCIKINNFKSYLAYLHKFVMVSRDLLKTKNKSTMWIVTILFWKHS